MSKTSRTRRGLDIKQNNLETLEWKRIQSPANHRLSSFKAETSPSVDVTLLTAAIGLTAIICTLARRPALRVGVEEGEDKVFVVFTPSQTHNSLIRTLENDKLAGDEKGKNLELAQKRKKGKKKTHCARRETVVAKTLGMEPKAPRRDWE